MSWITVKKYAHKTNTSVTAVYKKIKTGSVKSKKVKGITLVQDNSIIAVKTPSNEDKTAQMDQTEEQKIENEEWSRLQNEERKVKLELQFEKLKNLREDTLIKKQKQTYTKELYRQEYVDGVFEAFTDAFSNIKNLIVELKLKKEDNAKFKKVFSDCIKKFELNLKKYLAEADKKEFEEQVVQNETE